MYITIGNKTIYFDGYIINLTEKSILFYEEKTALDYIPPIQVDADMLSEFGKTVLCGAKMKGEVQE